jgi:protein-L-isoaspartate(D-aspartate) O-methyltransferase
MWNGVLHRNHGRVGWTKGPRDSSRDRPGASAQARENLSAYSNVEVVHEDGGGVDTGVRDAILINAGVTHPRESWIDNLESAGTLILPLTIEVGMPHVGKGMVLWVSRLCSGYRAHFLPIPVMIYSCSSVRDSEFGSLLSQSFMSGTFRSVKSLRRHPHSCEPGCWLHRSAFCMSTRPLAAFWSSWYRASLSFNVL